MIALAAMVLAFQSPQTQTDMEGRTLVRTYRSPVRGTARCLRDLPEGRPFAVPITCRVNSIGGPTQCMFERETSREERYAAECVSRGYRFNWEDGSPATGARVRFTVRMLTR